MMYTRCIYWYFLGFMVFIFATCFGICRIWGFQWWRFKSCTTVLLGITTQKISTWMVWVAQKYLWNSCKHCKWFAYSDSGCASLAL